MYTTGTLSFPATADPMAEPKGAMKVKGMVCTPAMVPEEPCIS